MQKHITFTDIENSYHKLKTRRQVFLGKMDEIIPWADMVNLIRPYYPSGKRGRPPKSIETMLRMLLLQSWFGLADFAVEEAIYDSYAMQDFLNIDFAFEQVPDATTLLKFRHLLEEHGIGKEIFNLINKKLEDAELMMRGGTIVDATIIAAPSSTKNATKSRDPEMHQTKKGQQYYFGMKIHAGVDAASGLVHTLTATAANVHDICETSKLIRKDDEVVYADSGYQGLQKREEIESDEHLSKIDYRICARPSSLKITKEYKGINYEREIEHRKSSVRCKVEHPFLIVKKLFTYSKTVYRGLAKNLNRFYILFASANLLMCVRADRTEDFINGAVCA